MNVIAYAAVLPFSLTLEEWGKIQNDIRRVVGENLLHIRGSGVQFEEAGLMDHAYLMLKKEMLKHYSEDELQDLET